ncbi:hypothetical protein PR202_gb22186 [Eleusine coracana subsp. coracana]|uniref:Thaumatin-like protein n=1 Tax=Eleusine coracana subsp. coracana TaxID=191504 RepID=A0AAV5FD39_ELECO|nr:hypothetical protein PR202_gb22186 [Eleusine coracana subsp. coracana]
MGSSSWLQQASAAMTFTISNYCSYPIWPGTLAGSGTPQLSTTGFRLEPGQTVRLATPAGWSGRIWARTGCVFDADGQGVCQTGDCGGRMQCAGAGATPPATLFEVTLGKQGSSDQDFYDVSLVDGYNLPVVAIPRSRQGPCNTTGCMADLNRSCPKELQVDCGGGAIACRSAIKESDAVFLGAQMNGQSGAGNGTGPPIYNNGGYGFLPPIYNYGDAGSRDPGLLASSVVQL